MTDRDVLQSTPVKPRYDPSRNLIRWKPGQSGNPAGKLPGGISIASRIRDMTSGGQDLIRWALEIAEHGQTEAVRLSAILALMDRAFGKPLSEIQLSGPGGGPLQVVTTGLEGLSVDDLRQLAAQRERLLEQRDRLLALLEAGAVASEDHEDQAIGDEQAPLPTGPDNDIRTN